MRRIIIIAVFVLFLLSGSGCGRKPMDEEAKKKAFCEIKCIAYEPAFNAYSLLEETEKALGTSEFIKISETPNAVQGMQCIVCFSTTDGTDYYALYSRVEYNLILVRIRKENLIDGEVIYNRGEHDCRLYIQKFSDTGCTLVLENWRGDLYYSNSYTLEAQNDKGEWSDIVKAQKIDPYQLDDMKRLDWADSCELKPDWAESAGALTAGHYRLTLPVKTFSQQVELKNGQLFTDVSEDINLSCEFDINQNE